MPRSRSILKRVATMFRRQPPKDPEDVGPAESDNRETEQNEGGIREAILLCLLSPEVVRIGVWGMAGVGKTYYVKSVAELLQEVKVKLFDYIFYVNVSYRGSLRTLRNDIGTELGLSGLEEEEDEEKAAALLYDKLKKRKFLFVLDDLWEMISLEDLGVPLPTQENGCKLLVVTRNHKVCDLMDTRVDIKVSPLGKEVAWQLFCKEVGDVVQQPAVEPIAKQVVEECGGLPLAIKAVGEAMAGKTDADAWLKMLSDLMHCRPVKETWKKVFTRLKLSYDRLESEVLKDCFSAGSFYAKDNEIGVGNLIFAWIIEGYIDFTEEMALSEVFSKCAPLVKKLSDAGLLDEPDDQRRVTINRMMKKLAILVKSCKCIIKNGQTLLEAPEKEAWEKAERISLAGNQITSLNQNPNCPNLTAFTLEGNFSLSSISPEFFGQMPELRFLDLSLTKLDCLPESVCKLVKLRSLDLGLNRCLKNIAHIRALRQLLVLDLSGTPLEELPEEIGELTQLRHLLLLCTVRLRRIPSGIISKLQYMELFQMRASSFAWQTESRSQEATLHELLSLTRLSDISLAVRSVKDFEFLYRSIALQTWEDDLTIDCYILETSTRMSYHAESNKWKTEFEEEDMAIKLLSGAVRMAGNYEKFFQTT
ncbi:disease resistance protein At4g27190-like [Nymphaea colorata]|nr:disease resistance protein At4g27190-like [Nymphaea colorata]